MIFVILKFLNLFTKKYKDGKIIATGSIIYLLVVLLLYTKFVKNIPNLDKIKKYIFYLPFIDLMIYFIIEKFNSNTKSIENRFDNFNDDNDDDNSNKDVFEPNRDNDTSSDVELPIYKPCNKNE